MQVLASLPALKAIFSDAGLRVQADALRADTSGISRAVFVKASLSNLQVNATLIDHTVCPSGQAMFRRHLEQYNLWAIMRKAEKTLLAIAVSKFGEVIDHRLRHEFIHFSCFSFLL